MQIVSVTRDIITLMKLLRPAQIFQMTEMPLQHGQTVMEKEMVATIMEFTTGVHITEM